MSWSLCYLVLRRLLRLAALRFRSDEFKELEIVVLRAACWMCRGTPRFYDLIQVDRTRRGGPATLERGSEA